MVYSCSAVLGPKTSPMKGIPLDSIFRVIKIPYLQLVLVLGLNLWKMSFVQLQCHVGAHNVTYERLALDSSFRVRDGIAPFHAAITSHHRRTCPLMPFFLHIIISFIHEANISWLQFQPCYWMHRKLEIWIHVQDKYRSASNHGLVRNRHLLLWR